MRKLPVQIRPYFTKCRLVSLADGFIANCNRLKRFDVAQREECASAGAAMPLSR
jgi:hypothetical protein